MRRRSGRLGHMCTDAIVGFGASAIHSWAHVWQRSFTTITPGRSQVPAEKGQPLLVWHCGQLSGYAGFFVIMAALVFSYCEGRVESSADDGGKKSGVTRGPQWTPSSSGLVRTGWSRPGSCRRRRDCSTPFPPTCAKCRCSCACDFPRPCRTTPPDSSAPWQS